VVKFEPDCQCTLVPQSPNYRLSSPLRVRRQRFLVTGSEAVYGWGPRDPLEYKQRLDRPGNILHAGQQATKYDRRETRRALNRANLHDVHTMQGGRQNSFCRTPPRGYEDRMYGLGIE